MPNTKRTEFDFIEMAHYQYNWTLGARARHAGETAKSYFAIRKTRFLTLPLQGINGFSHEYTVSPLMFRAVQGVVGNL